VGLFWVPDGGEGFLFHQTEINLANSYRVTADGTRVVVLDVLANNHNVITSYRLPGAVVDRSVDLGPSDPNVAWDHLMGLAGDVALVEVQHRLGLQDVSGAVAWNVITGTEQSSASDPISVLAANDAGTVVRRTGATTQAPMQLPAPAGLVCLRTVDVGAVFDPVAGGLCGPVAVDLFRITVSPHGDWVEAQAVGAAVSVGAIPTTTPRPIPDVTYVPNRFVLLASGDVNVGTYKPILLPMNVSQVYGWLDPTHVLAMTAIRPGSADKGTLVVCGLDGSCAVVPLPPDLPEAGPALIPPYF
jgi:hypothetical protein